MNSYCFVCDVWHPVVLFAIIYNTHSQQNIFIIKIVNHNFNNNNNNNKMCSPCVLLFISYNIAGYILGNTTSLVV